MVVGHLREEVVRNMGVGDVVEHMVEDAAGAGDRGQGTAQPLPLLIIVVRQRRVRVLQQRDHDQPRIHKQVRHHVHLRTTNGILRATFGFLESILA